MWGYAREHEALIERALRGEGGAAVDEPLRALHARRLAWLQHERLVHLLVLLTVSLCLLLAVGLCLLRPSPAAGGLTALLLVLELPYLLHYWRLENAVQRWYRLADRLAQA
jgi:hypothetical protein